MRLAYRRKGEAVPQGLNDGSQALRAWKSAIKDPSRRVRHDWGLFRRFGCARRLLLRGNIPSHRTLRDGFVIERHSRHNVPGYHHSVPAGRICLYALMPIPASFVVAGCATLCALRILFSIWLLTPKTEFKIRRLRRLGGGLWVILVSNFTMQRLNHTFGSNPLNLCNLRNLWIFNLRDLG
jgi:hypothetical protein